MLDVIDAALLICTLCTIAHLSSPIWDGSASSALSLMLKTTNEPSEPSSVDDMACRWRKRQDDVPTAPSGGLEAGTSPCSASSSSAHLDGILGHVQLGDATLGGHLHVAKRVVLLIGAATCVHRHQRDSSYTGLQTACCSMHTSSGMAVRPALHWTYSAMLLHPFVRNTRRRPMTTSPPVRVEFSKVFNARCWPRRARAADSAHGASHTLTRSSSERAQSSTAQMPHAGL